MLYVHTYTHTYTPQMKYYISTKNEPLSSAMPCTMYIPLHVTKQYKLGVGIKITHYLTYMWNLKYILIEV